MRTSNRTKKERKRGDGTPPSDARRILKKRGGNLELKFLTNSRDKEGERGERGEMRVPGREGKRGRDRIGASGGAGSLLTFSHRRRILTGPWFNRKVRKRGEKKKKPPRVVPLSPKGQARASPGCSRGSARRHAGEGGGRGVVTLISLSSTGKEGKRGARTSPTWSPMPEGGDKRPRKKEEGCFLSGPTSR